MSENAEALDALAAEAAALNAKLQQDAPPSGSASAGTSSNGEQGGQTGATSGAPGGEHIPNPAPKIGALLTMARDFPLLARLLPRYVRDALDDATIAELAEAFGDLAVKYKWNFAPAVDKWKEEIRAALALGGVAWTVYQAMQRDQGEHGRARPGAERVVNPDPPNPAAGMPPVEPA